jgi:hypothetical protein
MSHVKHGVSIVELLLNPNFVEMLRELSATGADFLIVGGHALSAHGYVRATMDFDIWIRPTPENAPRVYQAVVRFGAPLHGLTVEDLATPGLIYQIGVKPERIDILTALSGVDFQKAWERRIQAVVDGSDYNVIGREDLIANKRASGRPIDLLDADTLERLPQ